jgi:hypothetical protein
VSPENLSDGQPIHARLALLIVGWVTVGALLYGLSTFLPGAILVTIALAAWVTVKLDRVSRKNKSLASHLCAITCLLTGVCALAMHFTHWREDVLGRLVFVGLCLGAGLIFLDRRADDWQS